MTVLPILRWGDPLLLARAAEVADPTAPEVAVLAADMAATMQEARGVGLAAPQVGVGLRLIVALDVGDREAPRDRAPLVLVNPVLEAVGDAVVEGMEGCLSIPGLRGVVPRFERVGWQAAATSHGLGTEPLADPIESRIERGRSRIAGRGEQIGLLRVRQVGDSDA